MKKKIQKEDKKQEIKETVCAMCNGTGRDKPEQTCPSCNGTGK